MIPSKTLPLRRRRTTEGSDSDNALGRSSKRIRTAASPRIESFQGDRTSPLHGTTEATPKPPSASVHASPSLSAKPVGSDGTHSDSDLSDLTDSDLSHLTSARSDAESESLDGSESFDEGSVFEARSDTEEDGSDASVHMVPHRERRKAAASVRTRKAAASLRTPSEYVRSEHTPSPQLSEDSEEEDLDEKMMDVDEEEEEEEGMDDEEEAEGVVAGVVDDNEAERNAALALAAGGWPTVDSAKIRVELPEMRHYGFCMWRPYGLLICSCHRTGVRPDHLAAHLALRHHVSKKNIGPKIESVLSILAVELGLASLPMPATIFPPGTTVPYFPLLRTEVRDKCVACGTLVTVGQILKHTTLPKTQRYEEHRGLVFPSKIADRRTAATGCNISFSESEARLSWREVVDGGRDTATSHPPPPGVLPPPIPTDARDYDQDTLLIRLGWIARTAEGDKSVLSRMTGLPTKAERELEFVRKECDRYYNRSVGSIRGMDHIRKSLKNFTRNADNFYGLLEPIYNYRPFLARLLTFALRVRRGECPDDFVVEVTEEQAHALDSLLAAAARALASEEGNMEGAGADASPSPDDWTALIRAALESLWIPIGPYTRATVHLGNIVSSFLVLSPITAEGSYPERGACTQPAASLQYIARTYVWDIVVNVNGGSEEVLEHYLKYLRIDTPFPYSDVKRCLLMESGMRRAKARAGESYEGKVLYRTCLEDPTNRLFFEGGDVRREKLQEGIRLHLESLWSRFCGSVLLGLFSQVEDIFIETCPRTGTRRPKHVHDDLNRRKAFYCHLTEEKNGFHRCKGLLLKLIKSDPDLSSRFFDRDGKLVADAVVKWVREALDFQLELEVTGHLLSGTMGRSASLLRCTLYREVDGQPRGVFYDGTLRAKTLDESWKTARGGSGGYSQCTHFEPALVSLLALMWNTLARDLLEYFVVSVPGEFPANRNQSMEDILRHLRKDSILFQYRPLTHARRTLLYGRKVLALTERMVGFPITPRMYRHFTDAIGQVFLGERPAAAGAQPPPPADESAFDLARHRQAGHAPFTAHTRYAGDSGRDLRFSGPQWQRMQNVSLEYHELYQVDYERFVGWLTHTLERWDLC